MNPKSNIVPIAFDDVHVGDHLYIDRRDLAKNPTAFLAISVAYKIIAKDKKRIYWRNFVGVVRSLEKTNLMSQHLVKVIDEPQLQS